MRYVVKRMSKAERLLRHWKDQEKHYLPRVDDAMFAQRFGAMRRKQLKCPLVAKIGMESGRASESNDTKAQEG
jgi:hypothetical protein